MRKARSLSNGAYYHVSARTNRKEFLLGTRPSRNLLLAVLVQAVEKFDFRIDNFVIMENHFHLLLCPRSNSSLSLSMKWILGVFTMRYNSIFKTCGHFWGARFFSCALNSYAEYLKVFQYIDQNPVKAGKVEKPEDWEWSGIYHHRAGRDDIVSTPPPWLAYRHQPLLLGASPPA